MTQLKLFTFIFLGLTLAGCGLSDSTLTPTSLEIQSPQQELTPTSPQPDQDLEVNIQATMTSTPKPLIEPSEEIPPPVKGGEIEIRIPFDIYNPSAEASGNSTSECVNTLPFKIGKQDERVLVEGEGRIECEFIDTPKDQPITYHISLGLDASFDGEQLSPTTDYPKGWLDAYLTIDGTITQFYTDYPPEAPNPCPESDPCQSPSSEVIPLPFHYEEGSEVTVPWHFILHLQEGEN